MSGWWSSAPSSSRTGCCSGCSEVSGRIEQLLDGLGLRQARRGGAATYGLDALGPAREELVAGGVVVTDDGALVDLDPEQLEAPHLRSPGQGLGHRHRVAL